jgi:hypothetical protein
VSRGGGTPQPFLFLTKNCWMLKAVWAYSVFKKITKHTCSHSEKIPEKSTRSMQCNFTWQTSSEYRRLTVPSGRTLKYISFVRKIQIPEIFGSTLVYVALFGSSRVYSLLPNSATYTHNKGTTNICSHTTDLIIHRCTIIDCFNKV